MASNINRKFWERKSLIEKRQNQQSAYNIQIYNNNIIDKFVEDFYNDEYNAKPSQAILYSDLWVLNKPIVYKQYNKIINSKYTSNESLFNMLIRNKADSRLTTIVENELERIVKNLDYTEQLLREHELNLKEYQKIAKREKAIANRKNILGKCIKNVDMIRSEFGVNIVPNTFSYKNLDVMSEALNRQTQTSTDWEKCDAINQQCRLDGKDDFYTQKEWVWTGKGKTTRHVGNDGQIVGFYDYFECVHDVTGKVDLIMYPCDPNGSPENCWICYCQGRYF